MTMYIKGKYLSFDKDNGILKAFVDNKIETYYNVLNIIYVNDDTFAFTYRDVI